MFNPLLLGALLLSALSRVLNEMLKTMIIFRRSIKSHIKKKHTLKKLWVLKEVFYPMPMLMRSYLQQNFWNFGFEGRMKWDVFQIFKIIDNFLFKFMTHVLLKYIFL